MHNKRPAKIFSMLCTLFTPTNLPHDPSARRLHGECYLRNVTDAIKEETGKGSVHRVSRKLWIGTALQWRAALVQHATAYYVAERTEDSTLEEMIEQMRENVDDTNKLYTHEPG
jgi:hypothetical protein